MPEGNLLGSGSGMVIGQLGSWDCSTLSGYKLIFVPLDNRGLAGTLRIPICAFCPTMKDSPLGVLSEL